MGWQAFGHTFIVVNKRRTTYIKQKIPSNARLERLAQFRGVWVPDHESTARLFHMNQEKND